MLSKTWDEFAADLTRYVRSQWSGLHRGAVLMPWIDKSALFAVVFGNNLTADVNATSREVELIRRHLHESELEDLGAGVSDDGKSWTLLVRAARPNLRTEVGQEFHKELMKLTLEDAVRRSWWSTCSSASWVLAACGTAPEST